MNLVASLRTFWPERSAVQGFRVIGFQSARERMQQRQKNREWLMHMISSQRHGRTCLPRHLGLQAVDFHWLVETELQAVGRRHKHISPTRIGRSEQEQEQDLRQQLLEMRVDEWQEIRSLLRRHRHGQDDLELVMADVLAAGCLGGDHLWRDLGLVNRDQLSQLMQTNFPILFERNSANMKWKKFFYKQLCEEGGGYVCRAPSCQECTAYKDCFGPEV